MKEIFGYRGLIHRKIDICEYHEKYHAYIHMRENIYSHLSIIAPSIQKNILGLSVSSLNENIFKFFYTQI